MNGKGKWFYISGFVLIALALLFGWGDLSSSKIDEKASVVQKIEKPKLPKKQVKYLQLAPDKWSVVVHIPPMHWWNINIDTGKCVKIKKWSGGIDKLCATPNSKKLPKWFGDNIPNVSFQLMSVDIPMEARVITQRK